MNILIAGVCGMLGSHLADSLINNNTIYGIDNLSSGFLKNIDHLKSNKNFTFIKHDVVEPIDINVKFDQIYNLASMASPKYFEESPIEIIKTNIYGTENLLQLSKKYDSTILFTSTSEVYGDPDKSVPIQSETYNGNVSITGIRSSYDNSKRCTESLLYSHNRKHGTKVRVVRLFNTYSERLATSDGRVISNFICQALKNEPVTVYGDGSQTRSLTYYKDTISGIKLMMNNTSNFIGPVNIGNNKSFTILELAKLVIELTNSKSEIIFKPLPQDDPKQRKPDISLAKEKLNWEPKIQLREGLIKTIEYFKGII